MDSSGVFPMTKNRGFVESGFLKVFDGERCRHSTAASAPGVLDVNDTSGCGWYDRLYFGYGYNLRHGLTGRHIMNGDSKCMSALSSALAHLAQDLKALRKDPPFGCTAAPSDDDMLSWDATITGPKGTPFEGGIFRLQLDFPPTYPQEAPLVSFVSKMFHPNIFSSGGVCLDMLKDKWSASYNVTAVLLAVQCLLEEPNTADPANFLAADMYDKNRIEFNKRVIETVEDSLLEHACDA
uniref:UBIQUITIN_CONJUGAT_2 domain-containing protein n=1 Tax=Steinernema glaseri TaxID=37863 RepID=A0A1I7YLL5_9BILA